MEKGTKILVITAVALGVILLIIKIKQKSTPAYGFSDLLTSIKAQFGIK
jgi:hypothetical protein